ncbi:hypothetical protein KVV02_006712 [Mortierella alpina]|uniref:ATP-dependent bile acid permease n=1 Tax=Mortierella alpina TaxID=64518 RepID=A0A9P7ZYC6_MORAP|nr:hypothetical protein KVV02_006712 [Mortierella alpina]
MGAAEDATLLLQPRDHSDRDPKPESFVNHPTNSDIISILVSMTQALGFLALVLVRWRFLEIGGRHGQPGHIHLPVYRFIMPVAQSIAWSYAFVLCMLAAFTRHIVRPSRIRRMLIVFSLFTLVNSFIRTRTGFRCYTSGKDMPEDTTPEMRQRIEAEFALAILNSVMATVFAFVITTTSKGPDVFVDGRKVSAEINASFFQWITYNWMNELLWEGYARALESEYLPNMTDQMRARPMYRIFARTRLYFQDNVRRSLIWRIYITNRRDIWINFVFGVVSSVASFGVPFFLHELLEYIENPVGPKEIAYLYVFGMLWSEFVKSLTFGQNLYYGRRVDVRLRAMLSAEVYAKSLRRKDMTGIVSERSKKWARSDTGMITNLMAVDANRVSSLASSIFFLYTCPLEIIISLVMLYSVLGLSSFVGIGVMLLTSPAHHYAAKKYAKIQEQLMETRDRRVGLMSELLQGIRMIKFFAWEKNIQKKIMEVRDQELRRFIRLYIINTFFTLLWFGSPILVTVMSFTSYTKLEHKQLTASVAFTSMAIFIILRTPLNVLPGMVTELLEAMVSVRRIEAFLNEGEIWKYTDHAAEDTVDNSAYSPSVQPQQMQPTGTIGFTRASFRWHTKSTSTLGNVAPVPNSGAFMLKDLTLNFPVGKLSLVCGATGSGKTSLLMALLREMDLVSGKVNLVLATTKILNPSTGYIPGTLAYVSQYPWLQQASIRENILFGSPFESERYKHVLEACALLPDLAVFSHGDLTEIGEKGITLSGGQKQRVALARAMYSRAQHLFFDDCLSAVDSHTARHIFENCLMGPMMKGRTRILVTHHVRLCLRDAAYVALLKEGSLALSGSPVKLIRSGMLCEILERNGMMEEERDTSSSSTLATDLDPPSPDSSLRGATSPKLKTAEEAKKLVDDEARSKGKVKLLVYNIYMKACGGAGFWIILVFMLAVIRILGMLEIHWLREWSNHYTTDRSNATLPTIARAASTDLYYHASRLGIFRWGIPDHDDDDDEDSTIDQNYFIGIYCLITLMTVFLTIVRMFWQFYGSLRASRSLYEQLLVTIIHAPIRFFDTTPVGRLLNRFSKDFEVIDGQMISKMVTMMLNVLGIIAVVLLISWVTPGFLIAAALIAMSYCFVGAYYIASSRELKRIESVTKSPLYSHFGETLIGVSTIRAFGVESRFMEEVLVKLDNNNAPYYFLWMCNRWLSIRVDFMGAAVSFIAGVLILANLENLNASWAGLSLGSAMNFMGLIYWLVRIYTEMEMSLNSVERVHEYLQMPQEPPAVIEGSRPPASWPHDGTIEIKNLTMQYAPDLGPVLHSISLSIRPREKIGIVGRTGSGKSTLALSLFRFMEPTEGSIVIDGIDISKIGLEDLRRRLTIIPQDAVLFNGTIRSNLDPFQEHADHEIWEALRRVHLVKARGSRSGSASSSRSGLNTAFYQNHQNQPLPHPHDHHADRAFDMNGHGHPHQHYYDAPEHTLMNSTAASDAADYESQLFNDPFHPAACPPTAPGSPVLMSPPVRHGYGDHLAESGCATGLLSVDAISPRLLCSPLTQADVAGATMSAPLSPSVTSSELIDPFESLDSPVSDGGYNFSQGQRQLLCMARALLRQSKVIIMDEEQGKVVEFDSPINLITNPSSRFRDMVDKSGECDTLFEMASRVY